MVKHEKSTDTPRNLPLSASRLAGESLPFREQAFLSLKQFLGEPEILPATGGFLYRWLLERPNGLSMYVTLDSPELPEVAHLIISDPQSKQAVDPVLSKTMRTLEEVEVVALELLKQWKGEP